MSNNLPIGSNIPLLTEDNSQVVKNDYNPMVTIYELEKLYVLKALDYFNGNKTQAANALGITIKTLYNKLHEYGEFEKYAVHSKGV